MVDRIRRHITFLGGQARASFLKTSMRILVVSILPLTTGGLWGQGCRVLVSLKGQGCPGSRRPRLGICSPLLLPFRSPSDSSCLQQL